VKTAQNWHGKTHRRRVPSTECWQRVQYRVIGKAVSPNA
jgi:hypothetical protein